ncbi:hypothetical protein B1H10_03495 [candidate division KSB1 bacterium 4484_188]|nr:MAG: hypothetical protein B1H10_03495 [candidate division KSB1 bacterium 4484_188]
MKLNNKQLKQILIGAAFFSTGGGGPLDAGLELIQGISELELVDLNDAPGSSICATAYLVGSIKAPSLVELKKRHKNVAVEQESDLVPGAFDVLQKNFPKEIELIVPVELGGHNTAVSFYLADMANLPVLNADLTGRSAPEMYQTGYYIGGIPPTPAGVFTLFGENLFIEHVDDYERLDDIFRELVNLCDSYDIGVANFPLPVTEAAPYMIRNTLTLCMKIGALLEQAKIEEAVQLAGGEIIFKGMPVEEKYEVKQGFTFGYVDIKGKEGILRLEYKNEIMVAKRDDKIIAAVPDLIGVVNEKGIPILNTKYKRGEQVVVFTVPSPELWRTGKGLEVFSLEHFGF